MPTSVVHWRYWGMPPMPFARSPTALLHCRDNIAEHRCPHEKGWPRVHTHRNDFILYQHWVYLVRVVPLTVRRAKKIPLVLPLDIRAYSTLMVTGESSNQGKREGEGRGMRWEHSASGRFRMFCLLGFECSLSKWVSERLMIAARSRGLDTLIYRPGFCSWLHFLSVFLSALCTRSRCDPVPLLCRRNQSIYNPDDWVTRLVRSIMVRPPTAHQSWLCVVSVLKIGPTKPQILQHYPETTPTNTLNLAPINYVAYLLLSSHPPFPCPPSFLPLLMWWAC